MAVNKVPVNKDKTKFKWKVVAYIPTNNYNSQGKPTQGFTKKNEKLVKQKENF